VIFNNHQEEHIRIRYVKDAKLQRNYFGKMSFFLLTFRVTKASEVTAILEPSALGFFP
jgi:hypothetical protein